MKKTRSVLFALATLFLASQAFAGGHASAPATAPADSLPLSQIIQTLEQQGFTNITDVEYEDRAGDNGVWEVEATNKKGSRRELKVDRTTGAVISDRKED
jgi:uncharacterized membrane protein YkoI